MRNLEWLNYHFLFLKSKENPYGWVTITCKIAIPKPHVYKIGLISLFFMFVCLFVYLFAVTPLSCIPNPIPQPILYMESKLQLVTSRHITDVKFALIFPVLCRVQFCIIAKTIITQQHTSLATQDYPWYGVRTFCVEKGKNVPCSLPLLPPSPPLPKTPLPYGALFNF